MRSCNSLKLLSSLGNSSMKIFISPNNNNTFACNKSHKSICRMLSTVSEEENLRNHPKKQRIGIQGACLDRGQTKRGVADGPKVVRSSGFLKSLQETLGHNVHDYGDITFNMRPRVDTQPMPNEKAQPQHVKEVAAANKLISTACTKIINEKRVCLTLGGDHSIGIGTVHGVSEVHNDLAVLWVDAHCDLNTVDTTNSGNIHGMTLAFVIKEIQPYMKQLHEFSWITPRILSKNVAYIGLRDVDTAERALLDMLGIVAYSMREVDQFGVEKVTEMALEKISPGNTRPLHVSFDIDALDDLEVGNTGTPVPGGLTLREGMTLLETVHKAGNLVSMDLVEINPLLGGIYQEKRTAALAKYLILSAFGCYRGGHANGTRIKSVKSA